MRWFLSRTHRNPTGSTQRTNPALVTDGKPVHTLTTRTRYMPQPHWQLPAVLWPRGALHCFPIAHMSGGSSSDWWDGWEWRGEWLDSSSPETAPTAQALDDQVRNTVHKLQDRLQKMIAATQRRSHKTGTERATSTAKGNAAALVASVANLQGPPRDGPCSRLGPGRRCFCVCLHPLPSQSVIAADGGNLDTDRFLFRAGCTLRTGCQEKLHLLSHHCVNRPFPPSSSPLPPALAVSSFMGRNAPCPCASWYLYPRAHRQFTWGPPPATVFSGPRCSIFAAFQVSPMSEQWQKNVTSGRRPTLPNLHEWPYTPRWLSSQW